MSAIAVPSVPDKAGANLLLLHPVFMEFATISRKKFGVKIFSKSISNGIIIGKRFNF